MDKNTLDFLIIGTSDFFSVSMINMAATLKKKGYRVGIISGLNLWGDLVNDLIKINVCHFDINKLVEEGCVLLNLSRENIEKHCAFYEETYDLNSMRDFVFPEMNHYGGKTDNLIKKAVKYFYALEPFLENTKAKCLIHAQGSEIISRVLFSIGKSRGIQSIFMGESLFPGRMFVYSTQMNTLDNFKFYPYDCIGPFEKKAIDDYITDFVSKVDVYQYPVRDDDMLFNKMRMLSSMSNNRFRYFKIKTYIRNRIIYVRDKILKLLLLPYANLKDKERYFYFPLHAWSDSQMTLRNPQFYRQDYLVELVARSLPQDCLLYVKEHPGIKIDVPFSCLRAIAKIKNVRLLKPEINSHSIIKNAQAIIIVNSTVGFEALHYFKPVIVLGNSYLKGWGATIDVDNLFELRKAVKKSFKGIDKDKIKALLFSLMKAAYPGSIFGAEELDYDTIVDSFIRKAIELGVKFQF